TSVGLPTVEAVTRRQAPVRANGPNHVYGHRLSSGGREWLQDWLFFSYNGQDRGFARTGRHQGDWEFAQLRLSPAGTPDRLDLAQHSWAEGCGSRGFERRGPAPVIYVANDSHALYPRPGVAGRPWPDPNDEADGQGRVVRPPVTEVSESRPRWMAYRGLWGRTRAGLAPGEESSPPGPRFQEDGRFSRSAAYSERVSRVRLDAAGSRLAGRPRRCRRLRHGCSGAVRRPPAARAPGNLESRW
ncbi:MAG: Vps62-related protein, partial [Actinomycetota bacterium]|nr:Vps62-related protein [Actinomycetota bacterium]